MICIRKHSENVLTKTKVPLIFVLPTKKSQILSSLPNLDIVGRGIAR
jgi:hypothetical protein